MSQRGVSPPEHKKMKRSGGGDGDASDGERSDQDLVVDDANEAPLGGQNGNHHSPRENGSTSHDKRSPRGSPGGGGGGGSESGGSSSGSAGKKRSGGDEAGGKKAVKPSLNQAKPAHQQPGVPPLTGGLIVLLFFLHCFIF
jgi:hypothetical protein